MPFSCHPQVRKKCAYSELFWSVFSRIRVEYGELRSISPYSVRMRENVNQNNSEYGHFSRSALSQKAPLEMFDKVLNTPRYIEAYSEPCKASKMECFAKIAVKYFRKNFLS